MFGGVSNYYTKFSQIGNFWERTPGPIVLKPLLPLAFSGKSGFENCRSGIPENRELHQRNGDVSWVMYPCLAVRLHADTFECGCHAHESGTLPSQLYFVPSFCMSFGGICMLLHHLSSNFQPLVLVFSESFWHFSGSNVVLCITRTINFG